MLARRRRANGLLRPRAEPRPGWLLLLAPLLLIALDPAPGPGSAMLRLAVVLLLGMVAWGMGRGPAGAWAERGFAGLLMVAWFAVCGTAFRLQGAPESVAGRLAIAGGLLLGPFLLLWAWRRRARLAPVVDEAGAVAAPGSAAAVARDLVLVAVALAGLDRLFGLEPADLLVIGTALALYAAFRTRGRQAAFGVPG